LLEIRRQEIRRQKIPPQEILKAGLFRKRGVNAHRVTAGLLVVIAVPVSALDVSRVG
jgi:hypothetical protein